MLTSPRNLRRLAGLADVLLIVLAIVAGVGFYTTSHLREGLRTVYEDRVVALGRISQISNEYQLIRRDLLWANLSRDRDLVAQAEARMEARDAALKRQWQAYLKTGQTVEEKRLTAATEQAMKKYEGLRQATIARLEAGDWDGATALRSTKTRAALDNVIDNIGKLTQLQIDVAAADYAKSQTETSIAHIFLISLVIAAIVGGTILAWAISRSIASPLAQVVRPLPPAPGKPEEKRRANPLSAIRYYLSLARRVEMEQALRESEQYSRMLFESSLTGLALNRMNGTFIDINPALARMLGRTTQELIGLNFTQITPEEYNPVDQREVENLKKNGRYGPYEKEFIHKDGHRVAVRLQGILVERGDNPYIWSSIEDISEQRQIDDQLRQSQKLQSLGTLAGGIAHEINNLLTPVIGFTELAQAQLSDEKSIKNLDKALKAAERARQMVRQILAFSHKNPPNRQQATLAPIVDEALNLVRIALPSNIKISVDVQDAPPVDVDQMQIQEVLINLCSNAAHAMMPAGGEIKISVAEYEPKSSFFRKHPDLAPGQYIRLSVSDTGHGMNKETLSRAFEPFFTTKDVGTGTGMGLSVVHGVVKAHGGAIEAKSELGKGTTFNIYLPAAAELPTHPAVGLQLHQNI